MSSEKETERSDRFVEILKKKSEKSLEFARKSILSEKIESELAQEALEYYTSNWAIFVHPGLFSLACEAAGGNPDDTVSFQAALAMLTASFDIHDDLIDGSKKKQGKPTVFGKFGKGMSVLLGDAFLIKGFTLLFELSDKMPQDKIKSVVETLGNLLFKLGSAHALEQSLKGRIDITLSEYKKVLELKASSVEADMRIGSIIGGGSAIETESLAKYGKNLGMLMTLREEFIDVFEPGELYQRMKNEYLPIPVLCAFQNSKAKKIIQEVLSQKHVNEQQFEKICDVAFKTKEVAELRNYLKHTANEAAGYISTLIESPVKTLLINIALAMLEDL
jgi:geranylgeranyl pyrophosphate synthase